MIPLLDCYSFVVEGSTQIHNECKGFAHFELLFFFIIGIILIGLSRPNTALLWLVQGPFYVVGSPMVGLAVPLASGLRGPQRLLKLPGIMINGER